MPSGETIPQRVPPGGTPPLPTGSGWLLPTLPPPPAPPAPPVASAGDGGGGWWRPLAAKVAARYGPWLAGVLIGWLVAWLGGTQPPAPPPVPDWPATPAADAAAGEYVPTFGWVPDPEATRETIHDGHIPDFADTPAGRISSGDDDHFLWRLVRTVNQRGPPWYPNVNQGSVGSCVGAGYKHGVDAVQAVQIARGAAKVWKPVSLEVIYAGSRVEVGGGRISGDGSNGSWAAKWVRDYGVVPMEPAVAGVDLSQYSPTRARAWGRSGVPDAVERVAKESPVKGVALVKTWGDVLRAVSQGYPVPVCSNQGFRMERDADGFARPQGSWAHCMCVVGVRGGNRPGGFILNSWGDQAHTGPRWPDDAPAAGFWADAAVIDRMVRGGDSFALSDATGFPGRVPGWFAAAPRKTRTLLALTPTPALAW